MIPAEYTDAVNQFPVALQHLIKAELAAGNSIVEIRGGSPASRAGACLKLAKELLSRPRTSDEVIQYYLRNNGSYDGQKAADITVKSPMATNASSFSSLPWRLRIIQT